MVKRWELEETGHYNDELDHSMFERVNGEYVLYSDYQALQKALADALEAYETVTKGMVELLPGPETIEALNTTLAKVSQLRSLYLGGGGTKASGEI